MLYLMKNKPDLPGGDQLDTLLKEILDRHVEPEDPYEIAAILESVGYNDTRVAERFGFITVFDLAMELWGLLHHDISLSAKAAPPKKTFHQVINEDLHQFFRGSIFALPMVLSILAMLTLKFSLWSYLNFSLAYGTAIGIGTFLSFATVGGFMQAIARRSFLYITLGYYRMARKVTFQFIRYGIVTSLLTTALLLLFNLFTNILTPIMLFFSVSYYLVLNAIWLGVTAMYILRKELVFTGLIILGIGLVYLMFGVFHINIVVSQIVAMLIVSSIGLIFVRWLFGRLERNEDPGTRSQPTKTSIAFYSVWQYFVFGSAYFSFLFMDRVMAWSTNGTYMPFFIWFRSKYELGLDFSLLMMVIPMGIAEVVITRMMNKIEWSQKNYALGNIHEMNQAFKRDYFRLYIAMAIISILSAVAIYFIVNWLAFHFPGAYGRLVFGEIRHYFVFYVALLSYAFVSVSLLNSVVMFSISEPTYALRVTLGALGTDAIGGFLFSRWLGSDYAVLGLLLGSILFLVMTTRAVKQVLDHLDYYLYKIS